MKAIHDAKGKISRVHLLDVGHDEYGDCVLVEIGEETILIDGGHKSDFLGSAKHPSIPSQLAAILKPKGSGPMRVSLLVVSHAHDDHIGCLPELVAEGMLTAEWALMVDPKFAWAPRTAHDAKSENAQIFVDMMREEPRNDLADEVSFIQFAADASRLRPRYEQMIRTLRSRKTRVVLLGTSPLAALQARFSKIDLKVLSPTKAMVRACHAVIANFGRDAVRDFADHASGSPLFAAYSDYALAASDAVDGSGIGPAINMQSVVMVCADQRNRFLFTGDCQLEKTEVSDATVNAAAGETLQALADLAPYAFAKIGHHGSYNAFGPKVIAALGSETLNFGICTGAMSTHHPSAAAIKALRGADGARWARTDRNGRVTFSFPKSGKAEIVPTKGQLNDRTLPDASAGTPPLAAGVAPASGASTAIQPKMQVTPRPPAAPLASRPSTSPSAAGEIKISVPYIPGTPVRVNVSISVESIGASPGVQGVHSEESDPRTDWGSCRLANGRELPPLLFVTDRARLAHNIGREAAEVALDAIRRAGQELLDLDGASASIDLALQRTREAIGRAGSIEGVVIVGGYDAVPAQRRDALTRDLETRLGRGDDTDRFIVWSDTMYGDVDGDGFQELPVSRIPDGHDAGLVLAALGAPGAQQQGERHGLRNRFRPFADEVFSGVRGRASIIQCDPHPVANVPYVLSGDLIYLMLHGSNADASRFWGESQAGRMVEALRVEQINRGSGAIVFTGCCWGALTVKELAFETGSLTPWAPPESIALRFLEQGALAFVGCTGVHYSPTERPFKYLGGPLHVAFWDEIGAGFGPASALFRARKAYAGNIPHLAGNDAIEAIERKLFEQFTCLGLGW